MEHFRQAARACRRALLFHCNILERSPRQSFDQLAMGQSAH